MQTHEAYGVVDKDGLCIASVSETRILAIRNWLGVKKLIFFPTTVLGIEIETAWRKARGNARVHLLAILVEGKVDDRI